MEVVFRPASSSLNPDAPLFVPWSYRSVEDFSDEWWELVQSSAWFRDYWLEERFDEDAVEGEAEEKWIGGVEADLDGDIVFDEDENVFLPEIPTEFLDLKGGNGCKDLVSLGGLKWRDSRNGSEKPRKLAMDKAPKIINVKLSPRVIQQPR